MAFCDGEINVDKKKGVWIKIENKCGLSYSFFSVPCRSIHGCILTKQAVVAHGEIHCSTAFTKEEIIEELCTLYHGGGEGIEITKIQLMPFK